MTAAPYDLELEQGASYRTYLTYTDDNGNALNLLDCTAELRLFDGDYKTDTIALTISDAANGQIYLYLTPTQTDCLKDKTKYVVALLYPSGDIDFLLSGRLILV